MRGILGRQIFTGTERNVVVDEAIIPYSSRRHCTFLTQNLEWSCKWHPKPAASCTQEHVKIWQDIIGDASGYQWSEMNCYDKIQDKSCTFFHTATPHEAISLMSTRTITALFENVKRKKSVSHSELVRLNQWSMLDIAEVKPNRARRCSFTCSNGHLMERVIGYWTVM